MRSFVFHNPAINVKTTCTLNEVTTKAIYHDFELKIVDVHAGVWITFNRIKEKKII